MNRSGTTSADRGEHAGLIFSIDVEGRFLMTSAMAARLPMGGVPGDNLVRLQDLLCPDSAPVLETLLADIAACEDEGLARRIAVRDREGRPLSLGLSRLPGMPARRLVCAVDGRAPSLVYGAPARRREEAGDLASRTAAFRHAFGLAADDAAIDDGFRILLVGVTRPPALEGPVAGPIWSRLMDRVGMRLQAVVGGRGMVARYADDAFVVIDARHTGPILPEMAPGAVVSCFDHPFEVEGVAFYVTVNLGVAEVGTGPGNIAHCFRCAELAMEDARRSGVPVREFSAATVQETCARLRFERDLREAFEYDGFELELQPKIDMPARGVRGFEALIRWRHPERGLILPEEFIPLAEETGLIVPITDWVLHEVCRLLKAERDAGRSPLPISINVPPSQLLNREAKDFVKVLDAYDVPPALVEFELTESLTTAEISRGIATMTALSAAGMKISMEDFGTGYSSLSRLVRLPVSILKIDRSFVAGLPHDPRACEVVTAITRVAHALDLAVVAEGVENDVQARFLADHGVETAQGLLFSRPLPPERAFRLAEQGRE